MLMTFKLKRNGEIWILSNANIDVEKRVITLVPIKKDSFIEVAIYDDTPSAHPTLPPASPTSDEDKP